MDKVLRAPFPEEAALTQGFGMGAGVGQRGRVGR